MAVNGNILALGLKIRSFQRKQRSQITFLPGERMVEIVIGIIRLDHRVIDRGVRDLQPADEIRVYLLTGGKVRNRVPGFRSRTRWRQWNKWLLFILGNCRRECWGRTWGSRAGQLAPQQGVILRILLDFLFRGYNGKKKGRHTCKQQEDGQSGKRSFSKILGLFWNRASLL